MRHPSGGADGTFNEGCGADRDGGLLFFSVVETPGESGLTATERKAVEITRYSSTDYPSVLGMSYGMIEKLHKGLVDLVDEENAEKEKQAAKLRARKNG